VRYVGTSYRITSLDGSEATLVNVKLRARKASGTHPSVLVSPRKRRKVSGDVIEQLTFGAVEDIPNSLI
jgi:hypothetical protein